MGKNNNLVPTPITDKNGVQTTRNKSAVDKPAQARPLPLPPTPDSTVNLTESDPYASVPTFATDIEAQDAAYAIPADAPILKSRLEYMRETFEPDEDDEDVDLEEVESEALAHARTTLWIDYLDTFENKMGTHGLASMYSKDVAAFIITNQNVEFNANNSLSDAVDEYLGLV